MLPADHFVNFTEAPRNDGVCFWPKVSSPGPKDVQITAQYLLCCRYAWLNHPKQWLQLPANYNQ